jgi:hypothetical protein
VGAAAGWAFIPEGFAEGGTVNQGAGWRGGDRTNEVRASAAVSHIADSVAHGLFVSIENVYAF